MILKLPKNKKKSSSLQGDVYSFKTYTTLHLKGFFVISPSSFFPLWKRDKVIQEDTNQQDLLQTYLPVYTTAQTFHKKLKTVTRGFCPVVWLYIEIIHYFSTSPSGFGPYWMTFSKLFSKALRTKGSISMKRQANHTPIEELQAAF